MLELSRQIVAYEKMQSDLETDHFGKWVVFYDEELVGISPRDHDQVPPACPTLWRSD